MCTLGRQCTNKQTKTYPNTAGSLNLADAMGVLTLKPVRSILSKKRTQHTLVYPWCIERVVSGGLCVQLRNVFLECDFDERIFEVLGTHKRVSVR